MHDQNLHYIIPKNLCIYIVRYIQSKASKYCLLYSTFADDDKSRRHASPVIFSIHFILACEYHICMNFVRKMPTKDIENFILRFCLYMLYYILV